MYAVQRSDTVPIKQPNLCHALRLDAREMGRYGAAEINGRIVKTSYGQTVNRLLSRTPVKEDTETERVLLPV